MNKKKIAITAICYLPVEIGQMAVLNDVNGGIIRTSIVEKVMSNSKRQVKFETRNSIYTVTIYRQSLFSKILTAITAKNMWKEE